MTNTTKNKNTMSKLAKANGVLGVGFVGLDSYMRIKDGENPVAAVGKALATNAMWAMAPGGVVGGAALMLGMTAAQLAPEVLNATARAKSNLAAHKTRFGSNFQSSEAQMMLQDAGLNRISSARNHLSGVMSNHARGSQRVY
jgi:hypothetical protein